jgi:phage-related protein
MADATLTLDAEINTSNWQKGVSDIDSDTDKIKKSANEADEAIEHIGDSTTETSKKSETLKDSFSNALDGISSLAENVGVSLPTNLLKVAPFAAAAAAVGSAIGTGITSALDTINVQGTLQAKLGSGSQAAKNAGVVAGNLYNDGWGESLDDIGNTVATVSQAIRGIGQDDLQVVSRATELWSQTFDTDVSEGVRGVKVLMDQFGLSSRDATDLMTKGMQNGLNYTGELADNLSEYSGRWAEAGVSAQDYFSMLQAGVDNGAYSLDKVGDFLNEFLTSLSDGRMEESIASFSQGTQDVFNAYKNGGATAQQVLNAVIGEMNGMTNETERATIASTLWSSLGEDNAWGMIGALANVSNSYGDVSGATLQAMNDSQSLGQQFDSVTRTMSSALGTVFMPVMQQVVTGLTNFANGFQQMMTFVDLTPFTNMVTGLFTALTPLGTLITNIAQIVLPIIQTALNAVIPVLTNIITVVSSVMNTIATTVSPVLQGVASIVQTVLPVIQSVFQSWGSAIQGVINAVFPFIQTVVTSVMNVVNAIISTVLAAINGDWSGVWEGIQNIVSSVWDGIQSIVSGAINAVSGVISSVLNGISGIFSSVWNGIKRAVSSAWSGITSAVSSGVSSMMNFITSIPSRIMGVFSGAGSWLLSAGSNIIQGLINGITGAIGGAISAVKNAVSGIIDGAKSLLGIHSPSRVFDREIGRMIPAGLGRGVSENERAATRPVEDMVNSLLPSSIVTPMPVVSSPVPMNANSGPRVNAPITVNALDPNAAAQETVRVINFHYV